MKKILFSVLVICLFTASAQAQFMVAKMVGKDSKKYGLGYGLFTFLDFPLASENQSIRVELLDFAFFPRKEKSFLVQLPIPKAIC